ncbi:MAG: SPOR domain-containing protein [Allosphingosinicella sp.]
MTDMRADDPALDRDDRLPWLEAVEEDENDGGPSALKLIVAVLIGLAAIGALVGGAFWLANRAGGGSDTASGQPETIKAPPGDYKAKPDNPGGMNVQGEGDTAFAASAGAEPRGKIDTNAVPETPVTRPPAGAPAGAPAAAPGDRGIIKAPPPTNAPAPAPAAAAGSGGATVQLGAFPSGASAEKAWKSLSGRFTYLAPLAHTVVAANVNGKTYYRLRASGPAAADVCGRLRVAGENCLRVD